MIAIAGTVPDADFPLLSGPVLLQEDKLVLNGRQIAINRGTPALLAATVKAGEVLGLEPPTAILVGDIGLGHGSRELYAFLVEHLPRSRFSVLCFHYLQPDVDWQYRILAAAQSMPSPPVLIADAGFMYAAKMGGQADEYDLFTPDVGELAFLADEEAPHPFYTRGFILHQEQKVPELIERAYQYQNAAKYLLVKGKKDYVAHQGKIVDTVDQPITESLEAIGGTGDTLTGIVTALIGSGMPIAEAAFMAAHVNRLAGKIANPTPAGQVTEIIDFIPEALRELLKNH
ncbi:MAG: NAD(P)H-hydrate dehydratase [bacterium]